MTAEERSAWVAEIDLATGMWAFTEIARRLYKETTPEDKETFRELSAYAIKKYNEARPCDLEDAYKT